MQIKDKTYIEDLLKRYKINKARLEALEKGLISNDDNILRAIDYSKDKVQTSNLSSLDNFVEHREKEKEILYNDVTLTEILLNSLTEKDYTLIYNFYIERKTLDKIAAIIDRADSKTVWRNKERILNEMLEVVKGIKAA